MTRTRDQVAVRAGNDVYTVLAAVAAFVVLLGVIALFTSSNTVFGDGLFTPSGTSSTGMK